MIITVQPSSAPTQQTDPSFQYYTNKFEKLRNLTTLQQEQHDFPLRFYIYENTTEEAGKILTATSLEEFPPHLRNEETLLHNVIVHQLQSSRWRTGNPDEADIFIIPINVNLIANIHTRGPPRKRHRIRMAHAEALEMVMSSPIYQTHGGNRHVAIAIDSRSFNLRNGRFPQFREMDQQFYGRMKNVTIVKQRNVGGCVELTKILENNGQFDFLELVKSFRGATTSSFSIGVTERISLPLLNATRSKFDNSSLFFFYHCRTVGFFSNSTIYRHWPMKNMSWAGLPNSSIGYDLEKEQWVRQFQDSKYCLVIRGDDPGSHSLARCVRVGCIPIVISDWMHLFSPVFKSTLDIRDFSIMIPEQDFLNDAEGELNKIVNLPSDIIDEKLRNIRYAQSIMLHDSPLFVEAFLKEAALAWVDREG